MSGESKEAEAERLSVSLLLQQVLILIRAMERIEAMSDIVDKFRAEVGELTTVVSSAGAAFKTLSDQIRANIDDKAALMQLATDLDVQKNALAGIVAENTPAAPGGDASGSGAASSGDAGATTDSDAGTTSGSDAGSTADDSGTTASDAGAGSADAGPAADDAGAAASANDPTSTDGN